MKTEKTEKSQMTENQWNVLRKQGYRQVGNHSAVKTCGWTKNSIANKGACYKQKFYGINSHQCLQMTTSMFCASRCKFCWRGQKAPVFDKWYGKIDNPKEIIENSINEHLKLLQGFKGEKERNKQVKDVNKKLVSQMQSIKHVALSLTGEPITYPKINEILEEFHKRKISTFLVTNAQYPEQIEKIKDVTQLYLSIDAPNKELLKKIDRPLFKDYWEKMLGCLDILKTRKYRTCIRLTLIKNENMIEPENYAELIKCGSPDFIELKSYVWVGESQKNYKVQNMPRMNEIMGFANKLLSHLPDYKYTDKHIPSRAVLLMKKSIKTPKINFEEFFANLKNN